LNIWLDSYGRKPSNTTSTVENLEKKGFMEFVAGETLNSHKTFRLTDAGRSEIRNIMCRLARKSVVSMA
jgi:DNA-binding MarR family transcriptional regulator